MTDYISRDAAIEATRKPRLTDAELRRRLAYIPAADVREVKMGKWEYTEMYYDDYAWVCSVCGETWVLNDGTPAENNMNYCPNCGADMREES